MSDPDEKFAGIEERLTSHAAGQLALAARLKVLEELVVDPSFAKASGPRRRAFFDQKVTALQQQWLAEAADESAQYAAELARLLTAKTPPKRIRSKP